MACSGSNTSRRNEEITYPRTGEIRLKQIQRDGFQPGDFQFNIEESLGLIALQDIAQKRHRQLLRRTSTNLKSPNRGIMANHGLAIGGESHVEFEAVASLCESPIK